MTFFFFLNSETFLQLVPHTNPTFEMDVREMVASKVTYCFVL